MRRFICWAHIGDPADLTIDLCQTFLFSLITRGMAAGTVNCYRAALFSWCNWLVRKGYLSENVALSCRAPRIVKAPPIYLTETEQAEVEVWAMALEVAFPVRVAGRGAGRFDLGVDGSRGQDDSGGAALEFHRVDRVPREKWVEG